MPLTVEDGTGIANAQTYASAVVARAYAALRGMSLPALPVGGGQDPVEVLLVLAMDYLEGLAYQGVVATQTQMLQWPRVMNPSLSLWDQTFELVADPSTYILPQDVINAQCQLCIEQATNGITLQRSSVGGKASQFVVREKVDVIEVQYSERLGTLTQPTMPKVDALLRQWIVRGGGISALATVRV